MPDQSPIVSKASFAKLPLVQGVEPIYVHFNPASLVHSVENTISQQTLTPKTTQFVSRSSAKLSMDLLFDTTDTGTDVRVATQQLSSFMETSGQTNAAAAKQAEDAKNNKASSSPAKTPPVLQFAWGSYTFQGIMDSFKETIDFFSEDGIALRSMVSIGLSRQDEVFDLKDDTSGSSDAGSLVPTSTTANLADITTRAGNPYAARALGAINGLASLRFTGAASLQVNTGVQLNPPTAFITPSASLSAGLSFGTSSGGGFGATFGASASAGVPATAGAFAGLQTGVATVSTTSGLDISRMAPSTVATSVATFPGASFSIGGAANNTGSAGLTADVGANFSFNDRLTFSNGN